MAPGNRCWVYRGDNKWGTCSFSTIVHSTTSSTKWALTAAHCGGKGTQVYINYLQGTEYKGATGKLLEVGTFTESIEASQGNAKHTDFAMIQFWDSVIKNNKLTVTNRLVNGKKIVDYKRLNEV